jgi:4-alpha-glucanotransferase
LVSLEQLWREGWLERRDLVAPAALSSPRVDYPVARRFRETRLQRAEQRFRQAGGYRSKEFVAFREQARRWLDDYALFCALRDAHRGASWIGWEPELRARQPQALERARRQFAETIRFHQFVQYAFERQWHGLRATCQSEGLRLMGDVPMFVAHDSAEVWASPEVFYLDARGRPTVVAGVPPDCFSRTGQLWGNPIYRWELLARTGFDWWLNRLAGVLERFDAVRLDHFIGFHRYWEVPGRARTALRGRFVLVPGRDLLSTVQNKLGRLPLVAEDLGIMVPEVSELRQRFGLPGMRVLQFGFGDQPEDRDHLPHRYPGHLVAYTGTHDNDTLLGWYRQRAPQGDSRAAAELARRRARVLQYVGGDGPDLHWRLIRLVLMSPADTAIIPLQDLLGLDSRARMNTPGTHEHNWEWRVSAGALRPALAAEWRALAETYDRLTPGLGSRATDAGSPLPWPPKAVHS